MAMGISGGALWILASVLAVAMEARGQQVPCYFIFGDSMFDNGNNNNLKTTAKVNYSPYGMDFGPGPTGRFSNGRNIPDVLAEAVGFKNAIPPFARAPSSSIIQGVNYASGGAGIRNESGQNLGDRISLERQIQNHRRSILNIRKHLKKNKAETQQHLNQCLYTINIGSNDYINNYFMPQSYSSSRLFTPEQFAGALIDQYSSYLKILYTTGARKVAVFGIGRIGCTPRMIASQRSAPSCAAHVNSAAALFNWRLKALVDDLNNNLAGAKFTYIDLFGVANYATQGFSVTNKSCCEVQNGQDLCSAKRPVCPDRTQYIFWDAVHGTEAVNILIAKIAYGGPTPAAAYPYNIRSLVQLK